MTQPCHAHGRDSLWRSIPAGDGQRSAGRKKLAHRGKVGNSPGLPHFFELCG